MGTFSKSFASLGGFVAADESVIHYIKHNARAMIFSASMPPAAVAAVLACIDILKAEPERRERLWRNAEHLRKGLHSLGFSTGRSETPIVPVVVGENEVTFRFWKGLFDNGLFVNSAVSPAVPPGHGLLRTSVMATHEISQIDHALEIFEKVGKELGFI